MSDFGTSLKRIFRTIGFIILAVVVLAIIMDPEALLQVIRSIFTR
jgi:hypothetical protein